MHLIHVYIFVNRDGISVLVYARVAISNIIIGVYFIIMWDNAMLLLFVVLCNYVVLVKVVVYSTRDATHTIDFFGKVYVEGLFV